MCVALWKWQKYISGYREIEMIGKGRWCEVFLAEDIATGTHVALKK
jgi:hypothetical protein